MRRLISIMLSKTALTGVAVLALAAGGAALVHYPTARETLAQGTRQIQSRAVDVTASMGMRLENLTVEGRAMTSREDLLAAVDADRGTPILAIDVAKAREAIEALPWVKTARVERHLPDTVQIEIQERAPYALWQEGTRYTLVDREGKPIIEVPQVDLAEQKLPLIVGADAPRHAAELFAALETNPDLANRVRSAVRVGDRRWNLYFDNLDTGMAVRLPEDAVGPAWTRLGTLERDYKILERDLDFVDLRLDDRLIVRVHKDPTAPVVKPAKAAGPKHST
jgi:cell division protein FtsQ